MQNLAGWVYQRISGFLACANADGAFAMDIQEREL